MFGNTSKNMILTQESCSKKEVSTTLTKKENARQNNLYVLMGSILISTVSFGMIAMGLGLTNQLTSLTMQLASVACAGLLVVLLCLGNYFSTKKELKEGRPTSYDASNPQQDEARNDAPPSHDQTFTDAFRCWENDHLKGAQIRGYHNDEPPPYTVLYPTNTESLKESQRVSTAAQME